MRKPALLEALADVRELRRRVIDNQIFRGYSGRVRIAGACLALGAAIVMSREWFPATREAHVQGWGLVCALAAISNFSAVAGWWKGRNAQLEELRPVLDLVAPFLVGGAITFALIDRGQHDLLFSVWMWLFGLMNISSRHSMPQIMVQLGWFYILAGTVCALPFVEATFTNPWPMGIVFFVGEVTGGIALVKLGEKEERSL